MDVNFRAKLCHVSRQLEATTVADLMTSPPATVDVEVSLEQVMRSLQERRIVRVPVTESMASSWESFRAGM